MQLSRWQTSRMRTRALRGVTTLEFTVSWTFRRAGSLLRGLSRSMEQVNGERVIEVNCQLWLQDVVRAWARDPEQAHLAELATGIPAENLK